MQNYVGTWESLCEIPSAVAADLRNRLMHQEFSGQDEDAAAAPPDNQKVESTRPSLTVRESIRLSDCIRRLGYEFYFI